MINISRIFIPNIITKWITEYKAYGEKSYVYLNKNIYEKMCMSKEGVNDCQLNAEFYNYIINSDTYKNQLGKWFSQVYNIDSRETLKNLTDIDSILGNAQAKTAILNSDIVKNLIN